jgi:hypothetical protein
MSESAWVFFCPPSWIIVGILDDEKPTEGSEYLLKEAAYIESVSSESAWAVARNPKIAANVHAMEPGSRMRVEAALIRVPADVKAIRQLTRASDKKTIKEAR